ncbi:MAG: hypothetical protein ABIO40_06780 [Devosia sp.]
MSETFRIEAPEYDAVTAMARFRYALGELRFVETLQFPAGARADAAASQAFAKLLDLTALVLGVSYFKLKAPLRVTTNLPLTLEESAFVLDVYSNGLGEFYARNGLHHFGRIDIAAPTDKRRGRSSPLLKDRALLPIGGGKDSLVSVQLLEAAGLDYTPFAVNPRGPILSSVSKIDRTPLYVTRTLDPEMIRLSTEPGYYNGHVPSTAIISMIAALTAQLFSYSRIVLSNERSASQGNAMHDGRVVNHQHSKSLAFERMIAGVLGGATGGAVSYFSLLRPYSEARIGKLFARQTKFDRVFSSCNRNFKLSGHDGPLWCGECPKCHFTFLILAPVMEQQRLFGIFGRNLLDDPANDRSFRELTGLAGQKPWECVGEIEEAAACLYALIGKPEWDDAAIVRALRDDLLKQYGRPRLVAALNDLMIDSSDHLVPPPIAERIASHAL